jgi:glycosyltransferase involved in cell wall biosynthesis
LTLDVFGDGPLRRELPHLARSLGLESQVRFRGFRTDVRDFLPRYRVYVHAASAESAAFPLAIIEAMAAGLPVLAADVAGISDLCHDGVETRIWSLDDPTEAAATLIGLLDDEPGRLKAAVAARERFRREFDADVVGPRLWSFLQGQGERS